MAAARKAFLRRGEGMTDSYGAVRTPRPTVWADLLRTDKIFRTRTRTEYLIGLSAKGRAPYGSRDTRKKKLGVPGRIEYGKRVSIAVKFVRDLQLTRLLDPSRW